MAKRDNAEWQYLDDIISGLWLGGIGLALVGSVVAILYMVVTGQIGVTGTIPIRMVFQYIVAPIVLLMTGISVLDVYGKRRVQSLFDMVRENQDAVQAAVDAAEDVDDE